MDITVTQAFKYCQKDKKNIILDVRTAAEWIKGSPKGAQCLSFSDIENHLSLLDEENTYLVICQTGQRSSLAVKKLQSLGFTKLMHVYQGYKQWLKLELPIQNPKVDSADLRYNRHHQLKGFGKEGQDKLTNSHVLLIGAGGLGSSSALYLAAAGIGEITIMDEDIVSISNLQRQIIHKTDGIGSLKVDSAKSQLNDLNPDITINTIPSRIDENNADSIISKVDIVIDGSDNLITRYLVNDMCVKYKKPLVYAAVYQYEAQLTVFDFRLKSNPCLRCLFPESKGFEPENCSTVGVLGVVPGIAGVMQATEAIKIIAQVGQPLTNKLLIIDLLENSFRSIKYKASNSCSHLNIS